MPQAWRESDELFAGIDHSAITVADTDRSIRYYTGWAFTVLDRQMNEGPEQARLDAIDGARVEVTGLRPPGDTPPHLELLCYRAPGTLDDAIRLGDARATALVFSGSSTALGPIPQDHPADGVCRRDPDGHLLLFPDLHMQMRA